VLSFATVLVGACLGFYRWFFGILVTREAGFLAGLLSLVSCSKPCSTCPSRSDTRASAALSRRASIPWRRALFLPSRRPGLSRKGRSGLSCRTFLLEIRTGT